MKICKRWKFFIIWKIFQVPNMMLCKILNHWNFSSRQLSLSASFHELLSETGVTVESLFIHFSFFDLLEQL